MAYRCPAERGNHCSIYELICAAYLNGENNDICLVTSSLKGAKRPSHGIVVALDSNHATAPGTLAVETTLLEQFGGECSSCWPESD